MRSLSLSVLLMVASTVVYAQKKAKVTALPVAPNSKANTENIYSIKKKYLKEVLHNPAEKGEEDEDNDLERFTRWFNFVEPRCYPSGDLPRPDVLVKAQQQALQMTQNARGGANKTTAAAVWKSLGPKKVPGNHNGIGRINCIVIDPVDTNIIYVGTACGGVWISHDCGANWTSSTDNFPSLSIADIAVDPLHHDTIYAATGDGYGYEGGFNIFWGGLYSAGVMKSTDGGATWSTTGLSYLQSNRDMIQKLLIHPRNPNILLAATRNGILRTSDGGATWNNVQPGHTYSMALHPTNPDTVYAIDGKDFVCSYDAGISWFTAFADINIADARGSVAVSAAAPNFVWVLNDAENLMKSSDLGFSFTPSAVAPSTTAAFYGYYDRVLAVSPSDSARIYALGMEAAGSVNGGNSWYMLDPSHRVHVDYHAIAINPQRTQTIYIGNDGGICVSRNGGVNWTNLGNGLVISQIYRMGQSQQDPKLLLGGLQDNGSFFTEDTISWKWVTGGDGMDCGVSPVNDYIEISSYQNGNFFMSWDRGAGFGSIDVAPGEAGAWISPVAFDAHDDNKIFFGLQHVYATYDQGGSFVNLNPTVAPFPDGATVLVVAPSNSLVIYAADNTHIIRTINGGTTWSTVTGTLPAASLALTGLAVDPRDPMKIYATLSGYNNTKKIYMSSIGGTTWTNITNNLPNVPANCVAVDTSTPGALFVGTDLGLYYTDSSMTNWVPYGTGLPNVIIDDIDINYFSYNVRVATYGRGFWECRLKKDRPIPVGTDNIAAHNAKPMLYPNPSTATWNIDFQKQKPQNYTVKVSDMAGRTLQTFENAETIDASALATGVYHVEIDGGDKRYVLKAIKK